MRMLLAMIRKEFQQLLRDPVMLRMALIAPAVQLLALGYAANLDVTNIPMVLVDQDLSAESRQLVRAFTGSGYFELAGSEESVAALEPWLVDGRAQVGLVINRGFGEDVTAGRRPAVQVIVDGSETTSASLGLAYASQIVARRSGELLLERLAELRRRAAVSGRALQPAGQAEAVPRVWYNPDLRSRWFYVPAVLAMVLMLITMILSSMGVVREKEIGTMEQLIVTPLKGWQIIAGKLLPFGIIGLVDLFLVIAIAVGWFRVPLRGSLILLVGLTLLFVLNTLSLGLLVSTLVRTQQQAMMASSFLVMMPMIYLSGLLFPIDSMPRFLQLVSYLIPLRYYAVILRGIFLKGAGIEALWPQAAALAGFGALFLTLASARFSKRLD
jgi:ABC-2 type transport system permease protein